ncbi:MAG: thermonuclease family protein [Patescibacteria group bacterium]|nr:thermonuclease family protein [Patescibacteria group bacterium]
MKTSKKISITALVAILAATGYGGYTVIKESDLAGMRSGQAPLYKVARVIDGDTFELQDGDVVRLLGIDAPEKGQCFYKESKDALIKLVEGKEVELRKDVTGTDDFSRLLRYAILPSKNILNNSVLVDEYMVEGGYADIRSDPRDKLFYGILLEKHEQAQKSNKGLWGACDYEPSEHSQKDIAPLNKNCTIKGNISTGSFGKTYFVESCNNYAQVKVDPTRGEQYFCSEKEAITAGFIKARYCP